MPGDIFDNRGRGHAGWSWPSIHPEGRKFGAIAGAIALAAAIFGGSIVAWPFVFLTLGVLAFFRDPVRVTPRDDRFVVAPADGLITLIQKVAPPRELSADDGSGLTAMDPTPVTRVSIFMSVFDVHVNRSRLVARSGAWSISRASSSMPISTRRARKTSASTSWSSAATA
jgi:phosphatidylserine decarboxylase